MLCSEKLVLEQVHTLDDIFAGIEHSSNVFSINGSGEVRVAEVPPVMGLHADFLQGGRREYHTNCILN